MKYFIRDKFTNLIPLVSIILPIYNAKMYLNECINSILGQTFCNFELLVLDDGSTYDSLQIAESYKDERIKIIRCEHNFIKTLNRGIGESKGKYIARMDADDIMHKDRLLKQFEILEHYKDISVCSTYAETFGLSRKIIGVGDKFIDTPLLSLLAHNIIIHPSVMMRKSFLQINNISYTNYPYAEDYKMWVDIADAGGRFYVISEALLKYRINENQVSHINSAKQTETAFRIQTKILEILLKRNTYKKDRINNFCQTMLDANYDELIDGPQIINIFYQLFLAIKYKSFKN